MEITITDREILESIGKYASIETFVVATLVDRGAPLKIKAGISLPILRLLVLKQDFEFTDGYTSMLYYYDEVKKVHIWRFEKESQDENIQ